MCGRFAFYSPREAITDLFGVEIPLQFEPRYNITPSQYVAVLRANQQGDAEAALLRWGLIPSWAKDPKIGQRLINARAETVHDKPSFRSAFRRRRCVVLADGFYEWRKVADGKQPYFIAAGDGQPFAMAGLWEHWEGDGEPIESCTIITTAANEVMQPLHSRMPVILPPDAAGHWIDASPREVADLRQQLASEQTVPLRFWPVGRAVNNPRNDSPELIVESASPA